MKNTIYFLFLFLPVLMQSCVQDDEDIFDKPAAERLSGVLKTYQETLTGATAGWLMEYYPKGDRSYGGYTVLLSFREDEVDIVSETFPETVTSLWSLKEDTGPVLSFDTYNKAFHFFSDPAVPGLAGLGYEGDYEFVLMEQQGNELVIKGKKTGNICRMIPLSEGQSWEETLTELRNRIRTITPPEDYGYEIEIEGRQVFTDLGGEAIIAETGGRNFEIDYIEGKDTVSTTVPFIYTSTGLKFYQPLTVGGKQIQTFAWSEIERALICTDNEARTRISIVPLTPNKRYAYSRQNWHFNTSAMSYSFREKWKEAQAQTQQQGLSIYRAYLTYEPENSAQLLHAVLTDGYYLYDCILLIRSRAVKWTDNEIEIEYSGLADENGHAFYDSCGGDAILSMLNGRYTVVSSSSGNPQTYTFIATDREDIWFELTTEEIYNL